MRVYEEIIKMLSDRDFDGKMVDDYIDHEFGNYIKKDGYPSELKQFFMDYYFPKNKHKLDELVNIVNKDVLTDEHRKVVMVENLMFHNKDSINDRSRLELDLINMFIFKENSLYKLDYSKVFDFYNDKYSREELDKVLEKLDEYGLKLNRNDWKIFGIRKNPYRSEEAIKNTYFNNKYRSDFETINGRYAELLIFDEKRRDESNFNIWVSKDIGDGFGYDIMSVDKDTYNTELIEVKSSISYNTDPCCLSNNESKIIKKVMNDDRYDYCIKYVSLMKGDEPTIYTFTLDKEMSRELFADEDKYVFNVTSNRNNKEYGTFSYKDKDKDGNVKTHIAVPDGLKIKSKYSIKEEPGKQYVKR